MRTRSRVAGTVVYIRRVEPTQRGQGICSRTAKVCRERFHRPRPLKLKSLSELVHLLQRSPAALAAVVGVARSEESGAVVQSFVNGVFGDEFDEGEEFQLIRAFQVNFISYVPHAAQILIEKEFERADSIGSFMRANTPLTAALTAYARCPPPTPPPPF
jgi:hypothetical protein